MGNPADAVATTYANRQFRSRLEARWAAFFDLCAWQWEYEPVDVAGYIPNFVLKFPHVPLTGGGEAGSHGG